MSKSDVLVICTYERETDLWRCLTSAFADQTRPHRIVVVDGARSDALRERLRTDFPTVEYLGTRKGLTIQRNVALEQLSDVDLIFFVDDDVEFLPGYFGLVRGCFRQEGVIGVGVSPLPNVRRNPSVVARLLGQDGLREGTVNRSGTNIGRFSGSGFAEWLPGCSMTYRRDAIGKVRFDERRGGYALGEDVDFGLRMHALGRLFWTSEPTIIHHQSPVNRLRRATLIRQSVRHKWTLAHDGLGNVSRHGVLLGVLGQAIFWLIRVLRWRSLEPLTYVRATLSGACDIARFGPIK